MSIRDNAERIRANIDPVVHPIQGYARAAEEQGKNGYFSCPLISQIDGNLWVGGCWDGITLPEQFKNVVSLYKWEKYTLLPWQTRHEYTMYDSEDVADRQQLEEIADLVNRLREDGPVLVHCQAGLNRSNLVTAFALMRGDGMTADDAIALLRERRSPMVLCNKAFEDWLHSYESEGELND